MVRVLPRGMRDKSQRDTSERWKCRYNLRNCSQDVAVKECASVSLNVPFGVRIKLFVFFKGGGGGGVFQIYVGNL